MDEKTMFQKFRIIACEEPDDEDLSKVCLVYYVQRKRWFGWQTQAGYHRGAPGDYAYQYCKAWNPYAHITYTIPEILKEMQFPVLPKERKWQMASQRLKRKFEIAGIVDIEKAAHQLKEHQANNPGIRKFVPPGGVPWKWRKE